MKILFVIDPLVDLKPYKDSSVAMMRAAQKRGHSVSVVEGMNFTWRRPKQSHLDELYAKVLAILVSDTSDWYTVINQEFAALERYDAIVIRKDPPFNQKYLYGTWQLDCLSRKGVRVINTPASLRNFSEKVSICEFSDFTAPTLVTHDMSRIREFITEFSDVVLKPLDGMGGSQIFRVRDDDYNKNSIIETLTANGTKTIMAQEYIPEIAQGDKRVLLIGGEVMPYCLARIPKAGETRGNLAAGGRGVAQELSTTDRQIASTLAPLLLERGLSIVGLDIIGDKLTEINVTSPTCMVEIEEQTGYSIATRFIEHLESSLRNC